MDFSYLILVAVMAGCSYRAARFVVLDDIIEGTRDNIINRLHTIELEDGNTHTIDERSAFYEMVPLWRRKLSKLITCPFCATAYTSALAVALVYPFGYSVPLPVYTWGAVWTGALLCWARIDSE